MIILIRVFDFIRRFFIAAANFGWAGAYKVFVTYRSKSAPSPISITLKPRPTKPFYFRGAADRGVISHFYKEGYQIVDGGRSGKVKTIIDAGANIGDETTRFRIFHPTAKIIAIEAESNNFSLLKKNTEQDQETICLNAGLWSHPCRLKLIPGTVNEDFRVEEVNDPSAEYDLEATSIEEIMNTNSLDEIDILKLDIEGAESKVFAAENSEFWLKKVKVIIMEAPDNDARGTTMLIFRKLESSGHTFNLQLLGENLIFIRDDVSWELRPQLLF